VLKWFYNAGGAVCVGLGFLGLFLPLLPTTPFLLLAAFLFSKGSPRLHRWLIEHRTFGPVIRDWQQHRVIPLRVKKLAVATIILLMSPTLVFGNFPTWLKALSAVIGLGVITLICSYPSQRSNGVSGGSKSGLR